MSDEPQYELSPIRPTRKPSSKSFAIAVVATLSLLAAGLLYRVLRAPEVEAPPTAPNLSRETPDVSAATPVPIPQSSLPSLDNSDALVREQLGKLSSSAEWLSWLAAEDLVRRFVSAVAAINAGKSPRQQFDQVKIKGSFLAQVRGDELVVDPASFARYDRLAAAVSSLDAGAVRSFWSFLHPLLEQAWEELAAPGVRLNDAVADSLDHLLATPEPATGMEIYLAEGLYRFADPALEALTPAQKHLLRMGPANGAKVREALRSLRELLEPPAPG